MPPIAPTSNALRDADAIQAQINVSVAHARRQIASWLPSDSENGNEEASEAENQGDFTPKPPRLGLGAPLPEDHQQRSTKKGPATNDVLKRRLMGRKSLATAHSPLPKNKDDDEPSSDEGGRSAIGKPKRKRLSEDHELSGESNSQPQKLARYGAFLDAHRVNKKKKRKQKKSKCNAVQQK